MACVIEAIVFDLDGVLIDSEQVWDEVRESYAGENGGKWHADAQTDMMGMNSREWSRYMHDEIVATVPRGDLAAGRRPCRGCLPPETAAAAGGHRYRAKVGGTVAAWGGLVFKPAGDRPSAGVGRPDTLLRRHGILRGGTPR